MFYFQCSIFQSPFFRTIKMTLMRIQQKKINQKNTTKFCFVIVDFFNTGLEILKSWKQEWPLQSTVLEESSSLPWLRGVENDVSEINRSKIFATLHVHITSLVTLRVVSKVFVGCTFVVGLNIGYYSSQLAQFGANLYVTVWCIKNPHKTLHFEVKTVVFCGKKTFQTHHTKQTVHLVREFLNGIMLEQPTQQQLPQV